MSELSNRQETQAHLGIADPAPQPQEVDGKGQGVKAKKVQKSATGRPPRDPDWSATATSLKHKFEKSGRTDWKEFAQELQKQLADGDAVRLLEFKKIITSKILKNYFLNVNRRK